MDGILAAEVHGRIGENYLLSGHWHSVVELAELAQSVTGIARPRFVSPMWLARTWAPFQMLFDRMMSRPLLYTPESLEALRGNRQVSHAKASQELGYQARPIADTIRDIYAWFDQTNQLSPSLRRRLE